MTDTVFVNRTHHVHNRKYIQYQQSCLSEQHHRLAHHQDHNEHRYEYYKMFESIHLVNYQQMFQKIQAQQQLH
jgi:hypothetical protein